MSSVYPVEATSTPSYVAQLVRIHGPHKHPRIAAGALLWMLGLYLMLFATGFREPSPQDEQAFLEKQALAAVQDQEAMVARHALWDAQAEASQLRGWFWERHPPERRAKMEAAKARVRELDTHYRTLASRASATSRQARAHLGLWSRQGVSEARTSFWRSFDDGKVFAQRQTFWDAIWTALFSQERELAATLVKVLFYMLINFFTGMTLAVVIFAFKLPWLIYSFAANPMSGAAFFVLFLLGAVSVVASYLALLTGATAGTAVVLSGSLPALLQQGMNMRPPPRRLRTYYQYR